MVAIEINAKTFANTGRLGPVVVGSSREVVREAMGRPTQVSAVTRRQRRPLVERFGDIEIGYDSDDRVAYLSVVFPAMGPPGLDGPEGDGVTIRFDFQGLHAAMTRGDVAEWLRHAAIVFVEHQDTVVTEAGVTFYFSTGAESAGVRLQKMMSSGSQA